MRGPLWKAGEVALCYDGAVQRQLVSGDRVKIRKSDAKAHLVKLSEEVL